MSNQVLEKIKTEVNKNKVLEKLEEEYKDIYDLLSFNEFNLSERLEKNTYYQEQFRLLYIHEKSKLNDLEDEFNKRAGEIYDEYKHKDNRDLGKIEIERYYLPSHPELIKKKKLIQLQNTKVEFFSAVTEAFKSQGFNIKSFIENLKIGG